MKSECETTNDGRRLAIPISTDYILQRHYLSRIEEITARSDYYGADPNLVAALYERRLHKILRKNP